MTSPVVIHFRPDRTVTGGSQEKMFKVKALVVGPCRSGKTILANFLADATETSNGEYAPTQGVRILEFESGTLQVSGRGIIVEVELWDCSGNSKFEACWPAITRDTQGVVFVYNPDQPSHERELDKFHAHFVQSTGLKDNQCVVFALRKPKTYQADASHPSHLFAKIPIIDASLEEDGEAVRTEFNRFLHRLLMTLHEKRDQEELNIMNS